MIAPSAQIVVTADRAAVARVADTRVDATLLFPRIREGTADVTVTASDTVPGDLVVLGEDELLAFHQSTVLMYLAVTPHRTIHLTDPPAFTFALHANAAASVPYFLSYRAPSAAAWAMPGDFARSTDRSTATITFRQVDFPSTLPAGQTQNFVLYYPSQGAA